MNAALNKVAVPAIRSMGFKGSLPHFRRIGANSSDLISFQFTTSGGAFCLEIAYTGKDYEYIPDFAKKLDPKKLDHGHVHPKHRLRLGPEADVGARDHWYCYDGDKMNGTLGAPDGLAYLVVQHLERFAEQWFAHEAQQGNARDATNTGP